MATSPINQLVVQHVCRQITDMQSICRPTNKNLLADTLIVCQPMLWQTSKHMKTGINMARPLVGCALKSNEESAMSTNVLKAITFLKVNDLDKDFKLFPP